MSIRVVRTRECDRCGDEIVYEWPEVTIGHMSYMVLTNGSGTSDSGMELDLCAGCATVFLNFMSNI